MTILLKAAALIEKLYKEKVPALPSLEPSILQFMQSECNFKCEHADGSFMDHLYFCSDYCSVHYKEVSPKVLFLHSIMGVGTVSRMKLLKTVVQGARTS